MLRRLSEQDHYQILEVDYSASAEEIQTAYENAREIYSNDSLVSSSILNAEERRHMLRRVKEAYNTLIAEDSRRLYDESLFGGDATEGVEPPSPDTEQESADGTEGTGETGPPSYPRLVKGAQRTDELLRRSDVQLGFKEEASGEFLRRARESAGLDLRSIAEETKIGVTMLSYIEEERLERLPAPVYLKSFVFQYAHCLGLDAEKAARTYLARIRRMEK